MISNSPQKVGIVTFFKGNYGSILQCYATCVVLEKLGLSPCVIEKHSNRFSNLMRFAIRCLRHPRYIDTFLALRRKAFSSGSRLLTEDKQAMESFIHRQLPVSCVTSTELHKMGSDEQYIAFLSGSDQIWGGHEYVIDSTRFIRFAPQCKRIAWAPSLGSSDIAEYNKRKYKKYILDYAHLSVREASAVPIIKDLTGKEPIVLTDPVFLLTRREWEAFVSHDLHERYVLCYFLDALSASTIQQIERYCRSHKTKPVVFGPWNDSYCEIKTEKMCGGPEMFVSLIANADCVFTDSFHALSFSLIMNTPFFIYKRNYAHGIDQSSRVKALLEKMNMAQYFEPQASEAATWDFSNSNSVILKERNEMLEYLCSCLKIPYQAEVFQ